MPSHRVLQSLLCASILTLSVGCSKQGSLTGPDQAGPAASLQITDGQQQVAAVAGGPSQQYQGIWPHEDGTGWAYRVTGRTWSAPPPVLSPSPDDAPVLTMEDAIRRLRKEPTGPTPETSTGSHRLQFNGLVTTASGVTRQNLQETLESDAPTMAATSTAGPGPAFLEVLRRARPDLAKKMGLRAASLATQSAATLINPTLLHGYAWEQTDQWIGTYGDLNQQIAWIFLTPDLRPGSEFSLQLVPDLADDVFLHARVLGPKNVQTEMGRFHHALEVLYLVDFGVSQATDADGNILGYSRSYLYGTIDYVAGVGPVRSYERLQLMFDSSNRADYDLTESLEGTTAPAP